MNDDTPGPTLDDVRTAVRRDLASYVETAGDWEPHEIVDVALLARAYRDLGGDLELPLTPLEPSVGRVEIGLVDRVAEHAVQFVAELPGLENALGHADILHGELEAITAAPTPAPPITGPST